MDHGKLFAKRLRRLRKERKLTLEGAAERADLSGNYWGDVERAKKVPSLDTIMAMAKALAVPAPVLLALERAEEGKDLRKRLEAIVSRCSRDQLDLICRVAAVIAEP